MNSKVVSCLMIPALLTAAPGLAQDVGPDAEATAEAVDEAVEEEEVAAEEEADDADAGGALVTLGLGLSYTYDDSDSPESSQGVLVDLGVFSETRSQRFAFSVGTLVDITDDGIELDDSDALLAYAIFNRNTEASIELSFREADADETIGDLDADTLAVISGTRETSAAALQLLTGREMPFSTDTTLSFEESEFMGDDPSLIDTTILAAETILSFTVDPRIDLRVTGTWSEETRNETVEEVTTRTGLGVGGSFLIARNWTGSADLTLTEIETETGGRVRVDDGLDIVLNATRTMNNGTLSFDYTREVTTADTIDTLSAVRDLGLANGAALSATVGMTLFESGGVRSIFGLTYDHEIQRGGTVTASFEQFGEASVDDEDVLRTSLDVAYRRDLTRTSFLSTSVTAESVEILDGAASDTTRATFGVEYGHDLAQDWSLVTRAEHTRVYVDSSQTDSSNLFSIGLERAFSFRP